MGKVLQVTCPVALAGPAKLLGLESGSNNSHESYQANQRKALRGRLIAYITNYR